MFNARNRIALAGAVALATVGLVACSSGAGSSPPGDGGNSAAKDPFHIDQPKNLKAIPDPCQLLSSTQVRQLHAGPPTLDGKSPWGQPQCRWGNQQLDISIAPDTVQGQGIRTAAYNYSPTEAPTYHVKGHPAVRAGSNDMSCGMFVGVSDKYGLSVDFTVGSAGRGNPEYADPCAMSDKIAGMVLDNLPPVK